MKCLNTYGGCKNEARYIKKINCSNFCSYTCYLLYIGKKKLPVPKRKIFDDPGRQLQHDLYIWALSGIDPRKPYVEPKKRGVKKGTKRGPYKKQRIKERTFRCKGCGRTMTLKSNRKKTYCSESCRRRYWRRVKHQKEVEEKINRRY